MDMYFPSGKQATNAEEVAAAKAEWEQLAASVMSDTEEEFVPLSEYKPKQRIYTY